MLGVLWFLQRRLAKGTARRRDDQPIRVVARQGIGAKAQLVVVEVDDARYVLGVTERGISVVDRLSPADAASAAPAPAVDPAEPAEFDRVLTLARMSDDAHQVPRLRERRRQDPLRGSILSPDTWRQTAEALRRTG